MIQRDPICLYQRERPNVGIQVATRTAFKLDSICDFESGAIALTCNDLLGRTVRLNEL